MRQAPAAEEAEKTFFESPLGVQIAWYASIVGVVLARGRRWTTPISLT